MVADAGLVVLNTIERNNSYVQNNIFSDSFVWKQFSNLAVFFSKSIIIYFIIEIILLPDFGSTKYTNALSDRENVAMWKGEENVMNSRNTENANMNNQF